MQWNASVRRAQRVLSLFLGPMLVITQCPAAGLPQAAPAAGQTPQTAQLKIVVVEGDGAINNVKQRVSREMIVQVDDENDRPVAGAVVTFALPRSGPGGSFTNGSKVFTTTTNQTGRSVAQGFTPNNTVGNFQVNE